jgi:hypothetical protein
MRRNVPCLKLSRRRRNSPADCGRLIWPNRRQLPPRSNTAKTPVFTRYFKRSSLLVPYGDFAENGPFSKTAFFEKYFRGRKRQTPISKITQPRFILNFPKACAKKKIVGLEDTLKTTLYGAGKYGARDRVWAEL